MMMQSTAAKEIDNKSSPVLYTGQLPSVVFLFSSIFMKSKTKKKTFLRKCLIDSICMNPLLIRKKTTKNPLALGSFEKMS